MDPNWEKSNASKVNGNHNNEKVFENLFGNAYCFFLRSATRLKEENDTFCNIFDISILPEKKMCQFLLHCVLLEQPELNGDPWVESQLIIVADNCHNNGLWNITYLKLGLAGRSPNLIAPQIRSIF